MNPKKTLNPKKPLNEVFEVPYMEEVNGKQPSGIPVGKIGMFQNKEFAKKILGRKSEIKKTLINEKDNPIRDYVRESWDIENHVDTVELCKEEQSIEDGQIDLKHNSDLKENMTEDVTKAWENKRNLYNSKLWIPKMKYGKIQPVVMIDKLYEFWDEFIFSYTKEDDKKKKNIHDEYRIQVFDYLQDRRKKIDLSPEELIDIQKVVEKMTLQFSEESIFRNIPKLIRLLINKEEQSAKDYLLDKLNDDKDKEIVRQLGTYTLECIAIWVLSKLFNVFSLEENSVRLATLIDQLDQHVRLHVKSKESIDLIRKKGDQPIQNDKKNRKLKSKIHKIKEEGYAIGSTLFSWLANKQFVAIKPTQKDVKMGKKDRYLKQTRYVKCLFDIKELPLHVNLPMVCPPLEWRNRGHQRREVLDNIRTRRLRDLTGGYLSADPDSGSIYSSYLSLLSSHDVNNFDIHLVDEDQTQKLCSVMNKLQGQPFEINKIFLHFRNDNWDELQRYGLVMPRILASIDRNEGIERLRKQFFNNKDIMKYYDFNDLSGILQKNIQASNYEAHTIKMAEALVGYKFYLPVFMDFRGRNYRYGPFHYHGCDLVRSLFLFADPEGHINPKQAFTGRIKTNDELEDEFKSVVVGTAFHFTKFSNYEEAYKWYNYKIIDKIIEIKSNEVEVTSNDVEVILYDLVRLARHPFPFLSASIAIIAEDTETMFKIPINLDASASAYQIMSLFLLDLKMAKNTNLISRGDKDCIQDIYLSMLHELNNYIKKKKGENSNVWFLVNRLFNRDIVKNMYMPIVYGKTKFSTECDLREKLSKFMSSAEIKDITTECFAFWDDKFKDMKNLMLLISSISWVAANKHKPVIYTTDYWTTIQDYIVMDPVRIWVYYDRPKKKRSQVTLRVPTDKKDTRKSMCSTFANFVHQKDALTVINFVDIILREQEGHVIPLYTVHDNFVTTASYARYLPYIYRLAILEMGHPLVFINKFIYDNVIVLSMDLAYDELSPTERVELAKIKDNYASLFGLASNTKPIEIERLNSSIIKTCLEIISPKGKKTNEWNKKIKVILECYEHYVERFLSEKGTKDWYFFSDELKTHGRKNDYSLHH